MIKTSQALALAKERETLTAINAALALERLSRQKRAINDFLQGTSSAAKSLKNLDGQLSAITGGGQTKDFDTSALDIPIGDISADVLDKNLSRIGKTASFGAGSQQQGLIDKNVATIKEGKGLSDILPESLTRAAAASTGDQYGGKAGGAAQVNAIVDDIAKDFASSGQKLSGTFEDLLKSRIQAALDGDEKIDASEIQAIRDEIQSLTAEEAAALKARVAISQQFIEAQRKITGQLLSLEGEKNSRDANVVGIRERSRDRVSQALGKDRSIQSRERGRRQQAQTQLGVRPASYGAKAGNVNSLRGALGNIDTERKRQQGLLLTSKDPVERGQIEANLEALGSATAATTNELKRLTDQSALAADIQGQIAKEQASRKQVGSKVQQFAFGSDQQRSDINQSFLDVKTAIGQGGIEGANDEQRARIGSLLDDFSDVEIPGAGGKTGRELKGEFAEKEARNCCCRKRQGYKRK